jgi:flagellar motor protein MotB
MNSFIIKTLSLFYFFFAGLCFLTAQTTKDQLNKKALKELNNAISLIKSGDSEGSIRSLDKVLDQYPKFVEGHYRKASILAGKNKNREAADAFLKGLEYDQNPNPIVYENLSKVYFSERNYGAALYHLDKYLSKASLNTQNQDAYKDRREIMIFRKEQMENPVTFKPYRLEGGINTKDSEYLPVLTADGTKMYFTRRAEGREDVYVSQLEGSSWSEAVPLEKINSRFNEAATDISPDGRKLYLTFCDRKSNFGSCDMYLSTMVDGAFQSAVNIGPVLNSAAWDAQASISADGNTIVFASTRQGGHGGKDLWISTRTKEGQWRQPRNIGESINTRGDDESPFLHPDGKTLYFRSNGHIGMGSFDIFVSRLDMITGEWSKAQNIGYPINTHRDEGALFVAMDGKTAYFSSDIHSEGHYYKDIYYFELPEENRAVPMTYALLKILDAETSMPVSADWELINLHTNEKFFGTVNEEGSMMLCLELNRKYALNISNDTHLPHSEHFVVDLINVFNKPLVKNIFLKSIPAHMMESEKSDIVTLNNVFFDVNQYHILPESNFELDKIADFLKNQPKIKATVTGHTDSTGDELFNQKLSEKRASAVVDALIKRGINPERLNYKGFGMSRPVASNDTEDGRAMNRRTELELYFQE